MTTAIVLLVFVLSHFSVEIFKPLMSYVVCVYIWVDVCDLVPDLFENDSILFNEKICQKINSECSVAEQ